MDIIWSDLFFHEVFQIQPSSILSPRRLFAGQSLTSVKVKAGEALRLHRTSVGEEAREEEEGAEGKTDGAGEVEPSGAEESTSADVPSRGVFSTISHAVQNTVKKRKR